MKGELPLQSHGAMKLCLSHTVLVAGMNFQEFPIIEYKMQMRSHAIYSTRSTRKYHNIACRFIGSMHVLAACNYKKYLRFFIIIVGVSGGGDET
jgi:hypothetical protein